ncbi:hypothetical protein PIB30_056346 [Stylosanthes scabra]|uniref:BHLH domain-containing protein n=1 Tax=Stylosanthes scabra TaxID=79078 RepID=A0ABU6XKW9_9FABA|nr:hypothetical protein [Stylosanthes scabra]
MMSSVMYSPVLKYPDEVLRKNHEMVSNNNNHHQQQQQQNSRLLRYRSAPSSFLESLVNNNNGVGNVNEESLRNEDPSLGHGCYHHIIPSTSSTSSSSSETMFSKLIQSNNGWSGRDSEEYGGGNNKPTVVKQETGNSGYSYWSHQIQSLPPNNNSNGSSANGFDGTFGVVNSGNSNHSTQSEMGVRSCSNLIRQKSSPAGFFSTENALREAGGFRTIDVSNEQPTASSSALHGHALSFSPNRPSSCLKRMPHISEYENEIHEGTTDQSIRNFVNNNGNSKCYVPNFTGEFWDGCAFNPQKATNADEIMFFASNALESQDSDFCSPNLGLTDHLSLPSSSTKMGSMEKFLQLQGTVPCKIRAKRGFATHPRSIAERVRRTRISERIKKLHSLFPKSDKQTSTAEMLDLTVEHIKELQEQVKMLTNIRSKCRCSNTQKQYS